MEEVIGVLRGVKGRTIDTIYDLFFTEKRVVAAILIHPSDFNDIYGNTELTTLVLGNFAYQRTIKMRSLKLIESRRSAFEKKTVDEILALHRSNFEIDYVNIISVTIREGFLTKSLELAVQSPPGEKVRFSLEKSQIVEAEELVRKVFSGKVKSIVTSAARKTRP